MKADARLALLRRARRLSGRLPPVWDRRIRETAKVVVDYRGARAAGLRGIRFHQLARHSPLLLAPFGDGQLLVDGRDQEVGRVVFMTGGYERIYMRTALDYLASHGKSVAGTALLDVGANIGTSTVDALLHFGFGRAVCFEPEPANVRLLSMNLTLNDLADRVDVHALALSDRDGSAVLARSASNSGDHRIAPDGDTAPATTAGRVRLARLDSLVAEGAVRLDDVGLVWIDTQGHEPFTLAGATSVTAAGMPILLEYLPDLLVGTGALTLFEDIVTANYTTVVDVHLLAHGCHESAVHPARDVARLAEQYRGVDHTDLLLLR